VRVKYSRTAKRSSGGAFVAPRTLADPNPSHSLKAAESAARCPHSGKGTARLLEAPRSLSGVISALYRLRKNRSRPNGKHHKLEAVKSITNCHGKKASQTTGQSEHHTAAHSLHLSSQHSLRHKLADTVSITRRGAQLASQTAGCGRHHKLPRASEHHKLPVTSKGEELARQGESEELAAAGKGEELARRVRVTNTRPGVRVKNWRGGLMSETVPLIRRFYGKQFFIPSTISILYMISDTNQWGLIDKFSLCEYKCTTENENHFHPLDTTLAGS